MQIWFKGGKGEEYWKIRDEGFYSCIAFLKKQIKTLKESSRFLAKIGRIYSKSTNTVEPSSWEVSFEQLDTVWEVLNSSIATCKSYGSLLTNDLSAQFLRFSTVLEAALENLQKSGEEYLSTLKDAERRYYKAKEQWNSAVAKLEFNNTGDKNWLENLTSKTEDQYLLEKNQAYDHVEKERINLLAVMSQYEVGMQELLSRDVKSFFAKREMSLQECWMLFRATFKKYWWEERESKSLKDFITKFNLDSHMEWFQSLCRSKIVNSDLATLDGFANCLDDLNSLTDGCNSFFGWWYQTIDTFGSFSLNREKALLVEMEKLNSLEDCGLFKVVDAMANYTKFRVTTWTV